VPRAPGLSSFSATFGSGALGRTASIAWAVLMAVPEGASALASWCSSMISTWGRYLAASAAKRIISTAPMAKFGAITPPSFRSAHMALSCSISSSLKPVVPTTGWLPASMIVLALLKAASGWVKSITTWAFASPIRSARSSPMSVWPTSSSPSSPCTVSTTCRPIRPAAPFTNTRMVIAPSPAVRSGLPAYCWSESMTQVESIPPRVL
jgi:hypothetical protein